MIRSTSTNDRLSRMSGLTGEEKKNIDEFEKFSQLGINLNGLNVFIQNCGGRDRLERLTTTEVQDIIIVLDNGLM